MAKHTAMQGRRLLKAIFTLEIILWIGTYLLTSFCIMDFKYPSLDTNIQFNLILIFFF